jgi:hypothetical protein
MAITEVNYQMASLSSGTVSMGTYTWALNDLLVLYSWNGGTAGPWTYSDNFNSGNYTNYEYFSNNRNWQVSYKVCNAIASSASVTLTVPVLMNILALVQYTGFLGTPTATGDVNITEQVSSSSAAVAGTSFNTSKPTELVAVNVFLLDGTNSWATAPSGWTGPHGSFNFNGYGSLGYEQIVSTQGTAVNLTGTLSQADNWAVLQAGFYDFVVPTLVVPGYSSAAGLGPG